MLEEISNLIELGNLTQAIGLADGIQIAMDRAEAFKAIALAAMGISREKEKTVEETLDLFGYPERVEFVAESKDDMLFDQFWSAWPKKRGSKKKSAIALKSLLKKQANKKAFVDMLCEDIRRRFEINQQGFDKLYALSYLNGERWEDELIDDSPQFQSNNQITSNNKPQSLREMTLPDEFDTSWAM